MSINHCQTDLPPQPYFFWPTPPPPCSAMSEDDEELAEAADRETHEFEQEPMFEKPLTPSDVGKLNRLVIPKQHAEKYFPLHGNGGETAEKGTLLSFEDDAGKLWKFRYSYWNSSQSYVLTKGWSRFVKEKRLDAGDLVLFARHRQDAARLFIGWRRRRTSGGGGGESTAGVGRGGWTGVFHPGQPYPNHFRTNQPADHAAASSAVMQKQTPSGTNSKRLRLFGVNLEWQADDGSSGHQPHQQQPYHHQWI